MNEEICGKCPIYNDGLLQIGIRKHCKVEPRFIENAEQKRVLVLAECPGENEDEQNKVLVGRSGQLIDKLLKESELDQFDIRVSNVVKCRAIQCINGKYKNRNPNEEEVKACSPYLREDWEFDPDMIIMLGKTSTKAIFPDKDASLIRGKGLEINVNGRNIIALSTFHPAACMYDPKNKPILLCHLTNAAKYLRELQ